MPVHMLKHTAACEGTRGRTYPACFETISQAIFEAAMQPNPYTLVVDSQCVRMHGGAGVVAAAGLGFI